MITKEQEKQLHLLRDQVAKETGLEIKIDKETGMLFAIDPKEGDAAKIKSITEDFFKSFVKEPNIQMFKFTRVKDDKESERNLEPDLEPDRD